jgi:hypothetical protein
VGRVDKHKQLRDLQSKLLGIELDLDLIEQDLDALDGDVNYLTLIEEETIYNINILKKVGVVAELRAYRQAWEKLANIRTKCDELRAKRISMATKLNQKVIAKDYYDKQWDILHREMEDDRVILVFRKRKDEE